MTKSNGFTLVESMIVATILLILVGAALPAATSTMEAARAGDARADLLASLLVASNRAALTGQRAVLCPSRDGTQCDEGVDWSGGWIVFSDPNADRHRDPDETLLYRQGPLAGKVRLHSTIGRTRIVYQGNGGNVGSNVTFTLCDGRGPSKAVTLVLSNASRLREGVPDAVATSETCAD